MSPKPGRISRTRAVGWGCRVILDVTLITAALVLALIPLRAAWVELAYSGGVYPSLQSSLTALSNRVPIAVCDVLAIAVALLILFIWVHALRSATQGPLRAIVRATMDTAAIAALVYMGFLGLWGLNYRREPLVRKLDFDELRINEDAERQLARRTIDGLRSDSLAAHQRPWPDDQAMRLRLRTSFEATLASLGSRHGFVPGLPKISLVDPYLGAAGISGFTNPFGLEVVFNTALLPLEKPFTLAHEWAHLAGFADESEANFIALLACARSDDAALRYTGWLALYRYVRSPQTKGASAHEALGSPASTSGSKPSAGEHGEHASSSVRDDAAGGAETLPPQVLADLRAIDARVARRLRPSLSRAQGRLYDRFLKANRVEAGVRSYALFVKLLLGTRFERGWEPVLRR